MDLELFHDVFTPSQRPRDGSWKLHSEAQTMRGCDGYWRWIQDRGLVWVKATQTTMDADSNVISRKTDLMITPRGRELVAEKHPEYKKVLEESVVREVELALEFGPGARIREEE